MVIKTKWVLVLLESVISGHQTHWVRDRAAEKVERFLFDPTLRCQCIFKEIKRKRGVNNVPTWYKKVIEDDSLPISK